MACSRAASPSQAAPLVRHIEAGLGPSSVRCLRPCPDVGVGIDVGASVGIDFEDVVASVGVASSASASLPAPITALAPVAAVSAPPWVTAIGVRIGVRAGDTCPWSCRRCGVGVGVVVSVSASRGLGAAAGAATAPALSAAASGPSRPRRTSCARKGVCARGARVPPVAAAAAMTGMAFADFKFGQRWEARRRGHDEVDVNIGGSL